MKKKFIALMALSLSTIAFAEPTIPMENYTPTDHSEYEMNRFWKSMRTDLKGDACYRRAQLWSYELYRNYHVKSSKIFIHYTQKFNRELDEMGRKGGMGWLEKKFFDVDGASKRSIRMIRSNITWDYHVAPLVMVDGQEMVLDRYLDLAYDAKYPYTENEAWKLYARPATPEEWVEALTVRGELLWEVRKIELENEKKDLTSKVAQYKRAVSESTRSSQVRKMQAKLDKYSAELRDVKQKMDYLEMTNNDHLDMKCERVDSIAEVDKRHESAWCFYTVAPMYYYNELDLRTLAYGQTGYNYAMPAPMSLQTEANYQAGSRFTQTRFNENELKDAQKEIKQKTNQ